MRCSCSSAQLLGFYGITEDGELYLHVKSYRQNRPLSNVVIYGDCEVQCQSCYRWHSLRFRNDGRMDRTESLDPPAEIAETETLARTNNR